MPTLKLSEKVIATLPPGEYHAQGIPKLYVRVSPTGRRVYVLRSKVDAKDGTRLNSVVTLGPTTKLSFKEACLKAHLSSPTKLEERVTLFTLIDLHAESLSPTWRPSTVRNYGYYAQYLTDKLGSVPLGELSRADLATVISSYAARGKVGANRLLSYTKSMLRYGVERGLLEHSPAEGLTPRIGGGSETTRERTLTSAEVLSLWAMPGPHTTLLRWLLLTGMRIGEAQKAQASHLSPDRSYLVIPAAHAKNKKERRVYLTPLALEQLRPTTKPTDLLFKSCSPSTIQVWLRKRHLGWTPHDLRRTHATLAASAGVQPHLVSLLLGHTSQGVTAIYNRHDYGDELKAAVRTVEGIVLGAVTGPWKD